jgi:uncharacterized protein
VFFRIRELELRKARFDVSSPPGAVELLDAKLHQRGMLHAAGSVELVSGTLAEIRVRGHLSVEIVAECDRCLEPALFPVDSDFDLLYRPATSVFPDEEVKVDESDAEVGFYAGDGLELNDVLREQILLSLPMQRICRESCKGICPFCGGDRNVADCDCRLRQVDDRWDALRNL